MNGFLLLDKPKGITSFFCVKKLRWLLGTKKMGFAGTLDPLATGLMIVAAGEATKMIPFLEGADKVYDVTIRLGRVSTTYDAEGELSDYSGVLVKPTRVLIQNVLDEHFSGEREQFPPAHSAVWVDGKRAYELARQNKVFKLKSRSVNFYDLKIRSYVWPSLTLRVHCSAGTYVRSLAHDLGGLLGCGGYVRELRRIKHGRYSVKDAVLLDDLTPLNVAGYLRRIEDMFVDFNRMELTSEEYRILENGGFIENRPDFSGEPVLAMFEGVCSGVLELRGNKLKYKRRFLRPGLQRPGFGLLTGGDF